MARMLWTHCWGDGRDYYTLTSAELDNASGNDQNQSQQFRISEYVLDTSGPLHIHCIDDSQHNCKKNKVSHLVNILENCYGY